VLISPEAAKAQSVVIDPKSFDARRTEFTLTLDNLNPALEYRLEVSCIGLQRDYGYSFTPNQLASEYLLKSDATSVRFIMKKNLPGMQCIFEANNSNPQTHTVTLKWGTNGSVTDQYTVSPGSVQACSVRISPQEFDLTTDPSKVNITVSGLDAGEFYDLSLDTFSTITSISPSSSGFIDRKYSDFGNRPSNPATYIISVKKIGFLGPGEKVCENYFNLHTFLPSPTPTATPRFSPTPTPTVPDMCKDHRGAPTNCDLPECESFCNLLTPAPTNTPVPPFEPTLAVELKEFCETVPEGDERSQCEQCLLGESAGGSPGAWTAIGCIPTDPAGFLEKYVFTVGMGLAGGIAFFLILWGGFSIIMSQGDPQRITHGKEIIVSAIAGLLLIIFSVFILHQIGAVAIRIPGFGPTPIPLPTSKPTSIPRPTSKPIPTKPQSSSTQCGQQGGYCAPSSVCQTNNGNVQPAQGCNLIDPSLICCMPTVASTQCHQQGGYCAPSSLCDANRSIRQAPQGCNLIDPSLICCK